MAHYLKLVPDEMMMNENTNPSPHDMEKAIVQVSTATEFAGRVMVANVAAITAAPVTALVTVGPKAMLAMVLAEAVVSLNRSRAGDIMVQEQQAFLNKHWTIITSRWQSYDWHMSILMKRDGSHPVGLLPMSGFPKELNTPMNVAVLKAAFRATACGMVYNGAKRAVRYLRSKPPANQP